MDYTYGRPYWTHYIKADQTGFVVEQKDLGSKSGHFIYMYIQKHPAMGANSLRIQKHPVKGTNSLRILKHPAKGTNTLCILSHLNHMDGGPQSSSDSFYFR